MLMLQLLLSASPRAFSDPRPPIWPDAFSISFYTVINRSVGSTGALYYDWTHQRQRIDHSGGAYECLHFYNTSAACSLIFNETGMWVYIPSERKCCLDMPTTAFPPNWAQNTTFAGSEQVGTAGWCNKWLDGEHTYWSQVKGEHVSCRFAFPNPEQDMWFIVGTYDEEPQNPKLFELPSYCTWHC